MLNASHIYETNNINYDNVDVLNFNNVKKFFDGTYYDGYQFFGARPYKMNSIEGVLFVLWAPRAEQVSVVGNFNQWDAKINPMQSFHQVGIWVLFIPDLKAGEIYKFAITRNGRMKLKTDPYANSIEHKINRASVVSSASTFIWSDQNWVSKRKAWDWKHSPVSIYEVHLGSWQRGGDGHVMNYRELAYPLVDYVKENGFTHIEVMPITEYPFAGSWGYQTTGYFAVTNRYGSEDDFRFFVNHCHKNNIGVILDWTPAHFPKDDYALAKFDGENLYEYADNVQAEHPEWGTLIFDYARNEVKSFLLSSAMYWLKEFHLDGLRVDAVASMLHLNYARDNKNWSPNVYGGHENLDAVLFLKRLNNMIQSELPGVLSIAEDSTSWPGVTDPIDEGGLGFMMKWNLGWMHDTLSYMKKKPVYRQYHHDKMTFSLMYAFKENYMLPFSHDEVVHGKSPMIGKMPGDEWQSFATLRLLYAYMFTHPGKKLLFMGNEFAQYHEWNYEEPLNWTLLLCQKHKGVQRLVADLNRLYSQYSALHGYDFDERGFSWVDCEDKQHSVFSYFRRYQNQEVMVVVNATPVVRSAYQLMIDRPACFKEIMNTDSNYYGGSNVGNQGVIYSQYNEVGECSLSLTLPPLGVLVFLVDKLVEA